MNEIEHVLNEKIINHTSLSGGCIGSSYMIETPANKYFMKKYSIKGVSQAEALGLLEINNAKVIKVPDVIYFNDKVIVLEFIEEGKRSANYYKQLGQQLALLHKKSDRYFGFKENNFIGANPQINSYEKDWITFYVENRLNYQVKLAKNNGFDLNYRYNKLKKIIPDLIKESLEEPSLIHGDLWGGNIIANEVGVPILIDPAVYYGHREAELAMTKLFGGFSSDFYDSYDKEYPLKKRWQERENLYKLYHILNHLNLFGSSYYQQAISLMDYYCN